MNARYRSIVTEALQILESSLKSGDQFTGSEAAKQFARLKIGNKKQERFCAFFLNTKNAVIKFKEITRGTINASLVSAQDVARYAVKYSAVSVVLCHNHPSGDCQPSSADIEVTDKIREALALFDITVLDHLVVSASGAYSLAENNWR